MLKKKILGAKVLDTNGYVQATRLITPTNLESEAAEIKRLFDQGTSKPVHQIGDIYNANMVDIVAKAVSQGDAQLNDQVNAETATRKEEDNKLSERINQEIKDRKQAIIDLVNGAPEAFDTLKEISDYISEDKDFAAAIVNSLTKETNRAKSAEEALRSLIESTELSILQKAIIGMQSSSYDKNTNALTQTFVRGDGTTLEYTINLGDVVDSNDIENSDSTTMQYNNGKISTSVNTIGVDDVDTLFNN